MNKDALLTLHDVSAGYEGRTIISRVSIEVDRHTLLALQGPNGSGKTTMVRVMLGQLAPMHGHVIRQPNMRVGYMPQMVRADLDFPISVRDVILMGSAHASLWGIPKEERHRAQDLIDFAMLQNVADKPIGHISGGQRQRVMLCRALMNRPDLLILDEPVTYMDRRSETTLYALLPQLMGQMGIVLVTHDKAAAAKIATHIINLDDLASAPNRSQGANAETQAWAPQVLGSRIL